MQKSYSNGILWEKHIWVKRFLLFWIICFSSTNSLISPSRLFLFVVERLFKLDVPARLFLLFTFNESFFSNSSASRTSEIHPNVVITYCISFSTPRQFTPTTLHTLLRYVLLLFRVNSFAQFTGSLELSCNNRLTWSLQKFHIEFIQKNDHRLT